MRFSDRMAADCGESWRRMHEHPFVREIGDGSLPLDKFIFYLKQDYVYLIEFCRLLALGAAKAPDLESLARFADLLKFTTDTEMSLHRGICASHGVSAAELKATPAAPYCLAYTSFLLSTAYSGGFDDLVAALLPCAWGYYEVGKQLKARGLPKPPHYREWVETYASEEMRELVEYLRGLIEREAESAGEATRVHWSKIFARSVEFEVMFWEMSYHKLQRVI